MMECDGCRRCRPIRIITEAEHSEDRALAAYENALDDMLPPQPAISSNDSGLRSASHTTGSKASCRTESFWDHRTVRL